MAQNPRFRLGTARANRAGVMLMLITLCQWVIPLCFLGILRLCGVDTTADGWGLPSVQYLCLYLPAYLLMLGLPLVICRCLLTPAAKQTATARPSLDRRLFTVLLSVALCLLANILASLFSGWLYSSGVPEPALPPLGDGTVLTLFLDLIVFALVPAVVEEWLLRGIVLQTLRPLGNGIAVTVSAVLFGLMHGNVAQTPYTILMGLVLGWVYIYTDSLRACMTVHALANALAVIMSFLLHYSDTATAAFWESAILIVVMLLGGASALWLWRHPLPRRNKPHPVPLLRRLQALAAAPCLWLAVLVMIGVTLLSML